MATKKEHGMNLATRYGWLLCLSLALLAGCFESKQIITLNPDGSGKTEFDTVTVVPPTMAEMESVDAPGAALGEPGATKPVAKSPVFRATDPNASCRRYMEGVLSGERDKGVDAWSNLAYEVTKDGRCHVTGTAYFANIVRTDLPELGQLKTTWTKDKDGMVLTVEIGDDQATSKPAETQMSDKDAADALTKKREEYRGNRALVAQMLSGILIDATYMLPGKIEEVNIFEQTDKGGVRLMVSGKMILEAMDKIMDDEKLMIACIKEGKDPMKEPSILLEKMFGKKGPIRARVSGEFVPLFDYKAEMGKAKAQTPAMYKALGVSPQNSNEEPAPAPKGEAKTPAPAAPPTTAPATSPAPAN